MSKKKIRQLQNKKKNSSILSHWRIILVITTGQVVELEALPEVDGVNLLLHGRDGLLHG
jgi:hypothetical protein